ncbi:hypothetical protein QYF61_004237 [Mycteria americana]|uniref:Uncharacterized protein n=1 Tax=Mycteria americana TaxID=33587 RepID=A0AAN7N8A1_MYCAM|nr:hypothetical protein QYF61_004237 [Mycteria americana]
MSLPRGWSNTGTGFLEKWSMTQACQCLGGIWTKPLITCFDFCSALKCGTGQIHLSHFNLSSLIHLLVVLMFLSGPTLGYMSIYLEYSRPQILCIPDSKTLRVDVESPLVLSARGSSRRISSWMGIRESRLVRYCLQCTVVVAIGTCCSLTLSTPTTEGSSERPGKPVEKTMVKQVVPLRPMEVHVRADIHTAACGGPHTRAGGCAMKEAAAHGEFMLEQTPGRNHSLWRGAHPGAVHS